MCVWRPSVIIFLFAIELNQIWRRDHEHAILSIIFLHTKYHNGFCFSEAEFVLVGRIFPLNWPGNLAEIWLWWSSLLSDKKPSAWPVQAEPTAEAVCLRQSAGLRGHSSRHRNELHFSNILYFAFNYHFKSARFNYMIFLLRVMCSEGFMLCSVWYGYYGIMLAACSYFRIHIWIRYP